MVPLRENSREEGVCPICQEHLKEAVSTDCGHLFCRVCLARHVEKAQASGVLCCPLCRKPCSEGVLGAGYICHSHQKKVCWFCEESRLLLCMECLMSPEHKSHCELAIENAISHYKERLNRRSRKLRKDTELLWLRAQQKEKLQAVQFQEDCGTRRQAAELESQHPTKRQLDVLPQEWLDQLEDTPAQPSRSFDISRALMKLDKLVSDLEGIAKELDANTLKDASDLLSRSAPQKLEAIYPKAEKRISQSLLQPSSAAWLCPSLDHLISDSPQPSHSPSSGLCSLPLGPPHMSSGLPSSEHDPFPHPNSCDLMPGSLTLGQ